MHTIYRLLLSSALLAAAQAAQAAGPLPVSLRGVPIPPVPGLLDGDNPIVVDQAKAIALGKALFWDQNLGSDGQACASCHFKAGADSRSKNQLNPGQKSVNASGQLFDTLASGGGGPNYVLKAADFPLSPNSDDVVGSAGTFGGEFTGTSQFTGANDDCARSPDGVFHVGAVGTRRVEPRNAPTVINAVFNSRNLWDGRANNIFNGSSPWGPRDPDAGVWVKLNARTVVKQRLNLINSSLASQAVEPPVFNDVEVGCHARTWPDIGRKLLLRAPLQYQQVHPQDSVLGPLANSVSVSALKPGLKTTYKTLITQAFNSEYWSYAGVGPFGAPATGGAPYNQLEANFAMFFGLAIQLYESTLVSDQSPFDLSPVDANGVPTWTNVTNGALVGFLKQGFAAFVDNNCSVCHAGPNFSRAAVETNAALLTPTPGATFGPPDTPIAYGPNAFGPSANTVAAGLSPYPGPLNRENTVQQIPRLMDQGFVNIGVVRPEADPGLGGEDPFGQPLSFAAQYVQYLLGNAAGISDLPIEAVRACDFVAPLAINAESSLPNVFLPSDGLEADGSREGAPRNQNCSVPERAYIPTVAAAQANAGDVRLSTAANGAFKVPSLRNVELTAPYMHNGSFATLAQVITFYSNQGNFPTEPMVHNIMTSFEHFLAQSQTNILRDFLKSLTDERVRYERAPFDHPQLIVANGHTGSATAVAGGNPLGEDLGKDGTMTIWAVGANGSATQQPPFLGLAQ